MLVGAAIAAVLGACSPLYSSHENLTIDFLEGSIDPPRGADVRISEILKPIVGNPVAEVEVRSYFPYGDSETAQPNLIELAQARAAKVRGIAIDLGISSDLVASGFSAVGWSHDGSEYHEAPYPAERLQQVDLVLRVKADCHPLADLARQLNPY